MIYSDAATSGKLNRATYRSTSLHAYDMTSRVLILVFPPCSTYVRTESGRFGHEAAERIE